MSKCARQPGRRLQGAIRELECLSGNCARFLRTERRRRRRGVCAVTEPRLRWTAGQLTFAAPGRYNRLSTVESDSGKSYE